MEIRLLLSRLEQRKALQKKLKLEHVRALESIDAQIRELHEKRARIVIRNREATEAIQREITEIAREVKRVHSAQVEKPAPETPAVEALAAEASKSALQPNPEVATVAEERSAKPDPADDAVDAIRELLKNRGEMSESLLREKLRAKRVNVGELSKRLDKLVNAGILRRRGSNYSLSKKR